MWQIRYSEEAANYLRGDRALAFQLLKAMAGLMVSPDGLPPGDYQVDQGVIVWIVLDHRIYFTRDLEKNEIYISVIKPL